MQAHSSSSDLPQPFGVTPYRCRLCGAASYRRLTHRGPDGVMTYAGLYRCSGCSVTFSDPAAWREGAGTHAEAIDSTVSPGRASGTGQSFATGHMLLPRMPGEVIGYGHSEDDLKEIREAADRANRSKGRRR